MFVAFHTTNEVCNCASSPASRAAESHSGARRATERRSSSGATRARGGGERMANMAAAMPYPDKCVAASIEAYIPPKCSSRPRLRARRPSPTTDGRLESRRSRPLPR